MHKCMTGRRQTTPEADSLANLESRHNRRPSLSVAGGLPPLGRAMPGSQSSGLQAVADVAAAIKAGFYEIGIGAGLESMTVNPMAWERSINPRVDSHRKAAAATASGKFKDEIIPVKTKIVDPKTGDETPVTISVDDGIRPGATLALADLGKLKPVLKKNGTTTAGTSSQVSDGLVEECSNTNLCI